MGKVSHRIERSRTVRKVSDYGRWEFERRAIIGAGLGGAFFVSLGALGGNTLFLLLICAALAAGAMFAGRG